MRNLLNRDTHAKAHLLADHAPSGTRPCVHGLHYRQAAASRQQAERARELLPCLLLPRVLLLLLRCSGVNAWWRQPDALLVLCLLHVHGPWPREAANRGGEVAVLVHSSIAVLLAHDAAQDERQPDRLGVLCVGRCKKTGPKTRRRQRVEALGRLQRTMSRQLQQDEAASASHLPELLARGAAQLCVS